MYVGTFNPFTKRYEIICELIALRESERWQKGSVAKFHIFTAKASWFFISLDDLYEKSCRVSTIFNVQESHHKNFLNLHDQS